VIGAQEKTKLVARRRWFCGKLGGLSATPQSAQEQNDVTSALGVTDQ
jgi:hypothetical protein